MASERTKWADFAAAALKVTFNIVLPGGSEVLNSLTDLGRATVGALPASGSDHSLEQHVQKLNAKLIKQLRDFDAFETQVPGNEKDLAREIVQSYILDISIGYEAIESARFDPEDLIGGFESECVERLHRALLSEPGLEFGISLFKMVIRQILALTSALPLFQNELAIRTYLAVDRATERLQQSLEQIIVPSAREGTHQEVSTFEAEYRSSILRSHSRIQQFGLDDVSVALRWQPLDVTYISLTSSRIVKARDLGELAHSSGKITSFGTNHAYWRRNSVESSIFESLPKGGARTGLRLLISGTAGSGKTTVVKWLATRCAMYAPLEELTAWEGAMPFLVNLAAAIPPGSHKMPDSRAFIQSLASSVSEPARWLERKLTSGQAVIFFDGLDELSPDRQVVGKEWISEISERYPKCAIVVSSRPEAIDAHFFSVNGFSLIEIQPLSREQTRECIKQWFDAQCSTAPAALATLYRSRQRNLERDIDHEFNVRNLAGTPLLVAMLCAYYAFGYSSGPIDRVKLITGVITALVDGRDRARGVIPREMLSFTLGRKLQRLGEIAVFLFKSGARTVTYSTDAQRSEVRIGQESLQLRSPGPGLDPVSTTRYLLERSVVFHALGQHEARYAHAIFLEYLAGYQLAQSDSGSRLVDLVGLPGWYSVAAFFSASATGSQAIQFIRTMVERQHGQLKSSSDSDFRRMSYCLAECLGAARSYDEVLFHEVSELLQASLPPQNAEEVALLASVGPPAIAMLPSPKTVEDAIAYLTIAQRIRGEASLRLLEEFAQGKYSHQLAPYLLEAWTAFDATEYAQRVLAHLNLGGVLVGLETLDCANAYGLLHGVTRLRLGPCEGVKDLSFLPPSTSLLQLDLGTARELTHLDGIQRCSTLRQLRLPSTAKLLSLEPLSHLDSLRELYIGNGSGLQTLTPLANRPQLWSLTIDKASNTIIQDLRNGFTRVRNLSLECGEVSLAFLRGMPALERLRVKTRLSAPIKETELISHLIALRRLEVIAGPNSGSILLPPGNRLTWLLLSGYLSLDRESLTKQSGLRTCILENNITLRSSDDSRIHAIDIRNLLDFRQNAGLVRLEVRDSSDLVSAEGVQGLRHLRRLSLAGTGITAMRGRNWSIAECRALEDVELDDCPELSDLKPLYSLKSLAKVSLHGTASPSEVEELVQARPDVEVTYDPWIWHQETG